jgi:hypothetical protein
VVVRADLRITARSEALILRLPWVAVVWNRPVDLLVVDGNEIRRVRTPDVTRTAQCVLWACVFIAWFAPRVLATVRKESTS